MLMFSLSRCWQATNVASGQAAGQSFTRVVTLDPERIKTANRAATVLETETKQRVRVVISSLRSGQRCRPATFIVPE